MKKKEFEKIKKEYEGRRTYLEGIVKGQLVWEAVPRGGFDCDYHPAVVTSVNVDEDYVEVIDVSSNNEHKRYRDFFTEKELILYARFSEENIQEEYKKYQAVITSVKQADSAR